MKSFLLLVLATVGAFARAAVDLPPPLAPGDEQRAYIEQVIKENPWTVASGIAATMPHYVAFEQPMLGHLRVHPQFLALQADAPAPMTIHVEQVEEVVQKISTFPLERMRAVKEEVSRTLRTVEIPAGETLVGALEEKVSTALRALATSDAKGILVGMINCLKREERGPLFRIAAPAELRQRLAERADLTDEALRANFQGAVHRIAPEDISRDFLLARVQELLELDEEAARLVRARWFLGRVPAAAVTEMDAHPGVRDRWVQITDDPSAFDIASASEQEAANFFAELLDNVVPESKDEAKKIRGYLERVEKSWREAERVFEERKVAVGKTYFTIREMPARLAVYRGCLTGDCGTRDDYPFPYSPLERSFFIFAPDGSAIGYVGTTYVNTEGVRTLFVHDVTGQRINQMIREVAVNVLSQLLPEFGVTQMTLGVSGYVPYPGAHGASVANQYLDAELRQFFFGYAPAAHGDRPQDNLFSAKVIPQPDRLRGIRFYAVTDGERPVAEKKPVTPAEAFQQLLDLGAGKRGALPPMDFLGIDAPTRERILSAVNNDDARPLADYYARLEALFAEYDLRLSEKFMRKHENYFIRGHLAAPDLFTNGDPEQISRTVGFVISILRRGQDRGLGYQTIARQPAFFAAEDKFRAYVAGIVPAGPDNLLRIKNLIRAGVAPQLVAANDERLQALVDCADPDLAVWAIRQWARRHRPAELPRPMLRILAAALDNEKAESEETSQVAVKLLLRYRTDDEEVNRSLKYSVSDGDNPRIKFRAAVAMLLNGGTYRKIEKRILQLGDEPKVSARLRRDGQRFLAERPNQICRAAIAENAEGEK